MSQLKPRKRIAKTRIIRSRMELRQSVKELYDRIQSEDEDSENFATLRQDLLGDSSNFLANWDVGAIKDFSNLFRGVDFDNSLVKELFHVEGWDVSSGECFDRMFERCTGFNQDLSRWDTSFANSMQSMFCECASFNQPLNTWEVGDVTHMTAMFKHCTDFNQPLDKWSVFSVESVANMFNGCTKFNQPLHTWNFQAVQEMSNIFQDCKEFNQPLTRWNVSLVGDFTRIFSGCTKFNQPLDHWDVSSVNCMCAAFEGCYEFNQPLDTWEVTQVNDMREMFHGCKAFNQPLSSWDVSNVRDMKMMFAECTAFNQPLNTWTPVKATQVFKMFENCVSLQQNFAEWKLSSLPINTNPAMSFVGCVKMRPELYFVGKQLKRLHTVSTLVSPDQLPAPNQYFAQLFAKGAMWNDPSRTPLLHNVQAIYNDGLLHHGDVQQRTLQHALNHPSFKIEMEMYQGSPYPILVIPRGTCLYTGREHMTSPHDLATSFWHLYKLDQNNNLHQYLNKMGSTLTYFYPCPNLSYVVNTTFKNIDMVTTTKDLRLVCLVSPSPLCRFHKDNDLRNELRRVSDHRSAYANTFGECKLQEYDLCFTPQFMKDMHVHGQIAIAHMDSVSANADLISQYLGNHLHNSVLFNASAFNNALRDTNHHTFDLSTPSGSIIEEMMKMNVHRTYGIPEIALVPFDFTVPNSEHAFQNARAQMEGNLGTNNVVSAPFVFEPCHSIQGANSATICHNMAQWVRQSAPEMLYNCQYFPILRVWRDRADTSLPMLVSEEQLASLPNRALLYQPFATYLDGAREPNAFCAIETMFSSTAVVSYTTHAEPAPLQPEDIVYEGGKAAAAAVAAPTAAPTAAEANENQVYPVLHAKNQNMDNNKNKNKNNNNDPFLRVDPFLAQPISHLDAGFFYQEVNRVPIFALPQRRRLFTSPQPPPPPQPPTHDTNGTDHFAEKTALGSADGGVATKMVVGGRRGCAQSCRRCHRRRFHTLGKRRRQRPSGKARTRKTSRFSKTRQTRKRHRKPFS